MTTEAIGGSAGGSAVPSSVSVGPYRLVQQLGEGGMGVVHLALDPSGRAVALKLLRPHIALDPEARTRLAREVDVLSRVRDPHVAPVLDADLDGDQPYIVTRYVPGPSLDEVVREHGPLTGADLHRLGRGLAGPWTPSTPPASSTATSSPRTSCSSTATRSSSTSGSPTSPTTCGSP